LGRLSIITVIPAKAGIFEPFVRKIPACAGMTMIFLCALCLFALKNIIMS